MICFITYAKQQVNSGTATVTRQLCIAGGLIRVSALPGPFPWPETGL